MEIRAASIDRDMVPTSASFFQVADPRTMIQGQRPTCRNGMSNSSRFMSDLHQCFPVYYSHLGLFFPLQVQAAMEIFERAQLFTSAFKSEVQADTENLSHQHHCTNVPEIVHGSCSKKRSRADVTETSPTVTSTSTPQPESILHECLLKRMHNAHIEVQRNDFEKDTIENKAAP